MGTEIQAKLFMTFYWGAFEMTVSKVCVIGLGYIGLPTAAVLASSGVSVLGVDVISHVVDTINQGEIHIVEPGLADLVKAVVEEKKLAASLTADIADAFVIAVPTPFKNDHEPDLFYIEQAANAIAPYLKPGDLIILESTSPVGATEQLESWLAKLRLDLTFPSAVGDESDIRVAHCPERVLPGQVIKELVENDRVIGGVTESCTKAAQALYANFVTGKCWATTVRTAEMCKLAENSFRDVNIAIANELATIAERFDINIWELIELANLHPRVNILTPGPGVGGHCIAVDPWFLVHSAPEQAKLIHTSRMINDGRPRQVVNKVKALVESKKNPNIRVGCMGLAFKPNIDDLRESPALMIVECLADEFDVCIDVVEPNISELPNVLMGKDNVQLVDLSFVSANCDVVVFLVKHNEFCIAKDMRFVGEVVDCVGVMQ